MNPFSYETPKPSRAQSIAAALSGFGAGVQGRGPEFVQSVQAQQQQLDERRQKAMAQDAMKVYNMLGSGKYDDAISLIDNRVKAISELGGDPSDTLEIRQLIIGGRLDEASAELEGFLGQAMQAGLIEPPKAPEIVPTSAINEMGQITTRDQMGNFRANQAQGFQRSTNEPDSVQALRIRAQESGLQQGTPEYQQFMAQGGRAEAAPNMRERESRIQEYMSNFGLSRPDAIARLDAQFMTDPITGNLIAADRTTGSGRMVNVDTPNAPARAPDQPPIDLSQLSFDPGKGTGFGASFVGLYNSTLGQLPFLPTVMGAEEAAQDLSFLERDIIKAFSSSSRPPVIEQERLLKTFPSAMEWGKNPTVARDQVTSIVDMMTTQYIDDLRYSRDLTRPKTLREESGRRAGEIEAIFRRVLVPEAARSLMDSIKGVEADIEQVNAIPFEQLDAVDLEGLSDAALDIYIERMRSGR